jgi:hypothetical protein
VQCPVWNATPALQFGTEIGRECSSERSWSKSRPTRVIQNRFYCVSGTSSLAIEFARTFLKEDIMKALFMALIAFVGVFLASDLPGQEKKDPAKEGVMVLKTEDFPIRVA